MIETIIENSIETQTEQAQSTNLSNDVCVVILKVDNPNFKTNTKSYDTKLFGKTMYEWVANSVYDATIRFATLNFKEDFFSYAKNACEPNCKYTVVLFSDTPLFQRKTYLQILDYFKTKQLNVLKLTRGYVFLTEYLLSADNIMAPQTQYFEEEDFMTCYDLKQTAIVADVLKNRILTYFTKNGVYIKDANSVFVDADCQIEKDCVIAPNVHLKGNSIIESEAKIGENTSIENSIVCHGANVSNCILENSFVGKNCKIGLGCYLKNGAKIEDGVILPPYVVIDGVVVTAQDEPQSFKVYKRK